jgi:hypothetical protein
MKKLLFIAIFVGSMFFVKDVNAVGCCTGSVSSGTMTCPGSGTDGWYCSGTTTEYSCSGLDYGTCIDTRPTPTNALECDGDVPRCTGCGWSEDCSGGGGGGGGGDPIPCDWSPVNCPPGTAVGPLLSSFCGNNSGSCSAPGSAQTKGAGCGDCKWIPDCYTNPNTGVTTCNEDIWSCPKQIINTYTCVPINSDPIGFHDGSDCVTSYGWTCDPNAYSTPIYVDLYADGAGWGVGTFLGRVLADIVGGPELDPFCGGTRNHVFSFPTPSHLIDGLAHTIYAFAINTPADSDHNPLLINSPRTMTCTPTCTVDLMPDSLSMSPNDVMDLMAVSPRSGFPANLGNITRVDFSSDIPANVSVNAPATDSDIAYTTSITGHSGSATITANVVMVGAVRCSDSTTITVTNPGGWWQAKDGDITAENGSITSAVPSATYFNTDGTGGFPGVPTYYNGSLSYGSGLLSTKQWGANTLTTQSRRFDYSYFNNLIPSDFVSPTTYDGYVWTKIPGPYTHTGSAYGNAKNVLFVNGDLNITGNITLDDGVGFFAVFVSGNITVDPSVTNLEGIYLTDGTFSTGAGTSALNVRGSVASYTGFTAANLQRDLSNNTLPAEVFTFAPDQIALFPEKLGFRRTRWTEVAP